MDGSGGSVSTGGLGSGGLGSGGLGSGGLAAGGSPTSGGAPSAGGASVGGGAAAGGSGGSAAGGAGGGAGVGGDGSGGSAPTGGIVPGTSLYNCAPPEGDRPELQLTQIASDGLEYPIYVTHAPDDPSRLFVIEQGGVIKVLKDGTISPTPFLDISSQVSTDPWEQGLLGLTFHKDYATNGLLYVHYNSNNLTGEGVPNQANVVSEFHISDDPDVVDASSERRMMVVPSEEGGSFLGYHNGGSIFTGVDGELFIAIGDGAGRGLSDAPSNNSQDVTNLRGALLRILPDADGGNEYGIPAGNLAESMASAMPEIWSYGLRNPYRSNIDPCTGDIYIGDVGHFAFEEVNVEAHGDGHHNYGWPIYEGADCFNGGCTAPADYRPPVVSYAHSSGNPGSGSVIGGVVYRGTSIPGLRGTYIFSDLYGPIVQGARIFTYDSGADTISSVTNIENEVNPTQATQTIVSIQSGADGEVYFVGRGGATNPNDPPTIPPAIYKLEVYTP